MIASPQYREYLGEAWILENTHNNVRNVLGLAIHIVSKHNSSCGIESLDAPVFQNGESAGSLMESVLIEIYDFNLEKIEEWRTRQISADFELLLNILREEGTDGIASRLGCSQRSVQQKLVELYKKLEQGMQSDMFMGGDHA
jgi:hypothetical protein